MYPLFQHSETQNNDVYQLHEMMQQEVMQPNGRVGSKHQCAHGIPLLINCAEAKCSFT